MYLKMHKIYKLFRKKLISLINGSIYKNDLCLNNIYGGTCYVKQILGVFIQNLTNRTFLIIKRIIYDT